MNMYPSHRFALQLWRSWSEAHPVTLREFHLSGKRRGFELPSRLLSGSAVLKAPASTHGEIAAIFDELAQRFPKGAGSFCVSLVEGSPLEVLVGRKPGVRSSSSVKRHQCDRGLPRNAFLEIAPGVWNSSPELVFAQMASHLTYGELLALGYELCGSYPIAGQDGFLVRRPLTTPERLSAFLEQLSDIRAVKLARSAAAQVRRKSASIMETEVAIVALTPRRRGGLGLPGGRLNEPFNLSERGRRIARQKYVVGDLCWWECGVVLEYDGRAVHGSNEARIRDSRRRDALLAEGVEVVTVTSAQFANVYEFSEIAASVSEKAGKRFRGWSSEQVETHMELRRQVRKFHREHFPPDN
ncbi:hypothetical protein VJ923_11615 [Adlercreutzia sp. R25]|uniref:DUF559 domain-containing protein n=1 Tax=Adlercreutzia shanghongiae TaxID=3111773 RepID=A0ABU6IWT4_9ACTN|nr:MULTISPECIES: hypothetical protein [unclassified Adlercreutzia]MEC4273804.1 hypothetical protein [Adlercreutzia sp. R25]MEC4294140.1 hypothetical protein [Adlercreutzia sp. R22]